jgi:hypothetical protein
MKQKTNLRAGDGFASRSVGPTGRYRGQTS